MVCRYSRPKRLHKYLENCRRKLPHETWAGAGEAMASAIAAGVVPEPERAQVYLCQVCGKYHWGKKGIIAKLTEKGRFVALGPLRQPPTS